MPIEIPALDLRPWEGRVEVFEDESGWIEARRSSIGASEAYDVLTNRSTKVWLSKVRKDLEIAPPITEMDSDVAHAMEPVAAKWFAREHGREVRDPGAFTIFRDPECPIITATADFLALPREGLEAKAITSWALEPKRSPLTGWEVRAPIKYAIQGGQQNVALGLNGTWVYGLLMDRMGRQPGKATITRWVEARDDFEDFLRNRLSTWWERYVQRDIMPPVKLDDGADEVLRLLYPSHEPDRVYFLPSKLEPLVSAFDRASKRLARATEVRDSISRRIRREMRNAEVCRAEEGGGELFTYRAAADGSRRFRRSTKKSKKRRNA